MMNADAQITLTELVSTFPKHVIKKSKWRRDTTAYGVNENGDDHKTVGYVKTQKRRIAPATKWAKQ